MAGQGGGREARLGPVGRGQQPCEDDIVPGRKKRVQSTTLEALARSSIRGTMGSRRAGTFRECCTPRSHQTRAEEAQGVSSLSFYLWAPAKGGALLTVLQCPATMHMHMSNAGIASQPKRGFLVTLPARTSAGARKKARKKIWK